MIKRQMYGRAGFALLRHRILLGLRHKPSPPKVQQSRFRHPTRLDKLRDEASAGGQRSPLIAEQIEAAYQQAQVQWQQAQAAWDRIQP
jgi:hypothetical protein